MRRLAEHPGMGAVKHSCLEEEGEEEEEEQSHNPIAQVLLNKCKVHVSAVGM